MTGDEFARATMAKDKLMTQEVINALNRYGEQHGMSPWDVEVLKDQTKYDSLNGCWFFVRNGMYHGIEKDGYIHT